MTIDHIHFSAFRSHPRRAIMLALRCGWRAWRLDTGNDGSDDVLLGERDEVVADLLAHHGLDSLPETWSLEEVTL